MTSLVRVFGMIASLGTLAVACAPPAPSTATSWAGVYEREHVVRLLDEKRNETVTDRLVLEPDPSGGLRFDFELWFTNAHRCAMSGVASPKRDYYEWSDTTTNAGCALRIVKVGAIVHLEDFRGACGRAGHCGTRGKIDGSRLTRVSPARGR